MAWDDLSRATVLEASIVEGFRQLCQEQAVLPFSRVCCFLLIAETAKAQA